MSADFSRSDRKASFVLCVIKEKHLYVHLLLYLCNFVVAGRQQTDFETE